MNTVVTKIAALLVVLLMAAALFVGTEKVGQLHVIVEPWDKLVHFAYFGTMAALLAHAVGRRWIWVPLIVVPVVGALDEWHQSAITGRDSSFFDWLADEAGTLVFVAFYWYFIRPPLLDPNS